MPDVEPTDPEVTIIFRGWSRACQCAVAGDRLAAIILRWDEDVRTRRKHGPPHDSVEDALDWARGRLRQLLDEADLVGLVYDC